MKIIKESIIAIPADEAENILTLVSAESELLPQTENSCVIESATNVMASYQNANKWLDITKEFVYTNLGCVFFSSYIHELAHTMPVRFDKFGDILHTVNMKIPYPATDYIPLEPTNIDEVFNAIFSILDAIKNSLNDFIKCTDEQYHGMACAAEGLLNDIEGEYPMLYRMQQEWAQCNGDNIKFDKYVNQFVKNKDDLTESLDKIPEVDGKAVVAVDTVTGDAKVVSDKNEEEFEKVVEPAEEFDRKKAFTGGDNQPQPEEAEQELKKITLDESLFNEEAISENFLGTILGAIIGGKAAQKNGLIGIDDKIAGAIKGAFTGSAISNLITGNASKSDYVKLAGILALADLGDDNKLNGSIVTNALRDIKGKLGNLFGDNREEQRPLLASYESEVEDADLTEGVAAAVATAGLAAKFVANHWDEILQGFDELGIELNKFDSNLVDILKRHKELKAIDNSIESTDELDASDSLDMEEIPMDDIDSIDTDDDSLFDECMNRKEIDKNIDKEEFKDEFDESLNEGQEIVAVAELAKAAKELLFVQPWKAKEILSRAPRLIKDFIDSGLSAKEYFQKELDYYGTQKYINWFTAGCPTKYVQNYSESMLDEATHDNKGYFIDLGDRSILVLAKSPKGAIKHIIDTYKMDVDDESISESDISNWAKVKDYCKANNIEIEVAHDDGIMEDYIIEDSNGNSVSLLEYTTGAMIDCGLMEEIGELRRRALSEESNKLVEVCSEYIERCNKIAEEFDDDYRVEGLEFVTDGLDLYESVEELPSVGAKIHIIKMEGEPQYDGKDGVVDFIDDANQIHGTWGGLALVPGYDKFEIVG